MRVIAGAAKGHHLKSPPSKATRPTSDKIRGALFAMLESYCGVDGVRVLDLYAGTGALSIEALSRGAIWADLVDDSRPACAVIKENLALTKCTTQAAVHCMAVRTALASPYFTQGAPYDIILLDPPYADPGIGQTMDVLGSGSMIGAETVVVLEHAQRFAVRTEYGQLRLLKTRRHGDTCLSIFVAASQAPDHRELVQDEHEDSDLSGQL
jgi:16S rRNA (guanine966-N2)-methyltransferase